MTLLRATSIQRKLTLVVMLITTLALLIAATQFIVNDVRDYRRRVLNDLEILARVIGQFLTPTLDFEDPKEAERDLSALGAKPHVLAAAVYAKDGKLFAQYTTDHPETLLPAKSPPEGHRLTRGRIELCERILKGDEKIGTVYLVFDTIEVWQRVERNCAVVAAMLVVSALIALAVTAWLQRYISRPILDLARVANAISEKGDYSVRAVKRTEDELGFLIDCFNGMVGQIEKHQKALKEINEQLAKSEQRALAATEAKSQFLANMSHELRTPLNAIIGYSEMVREELEETGQTQVVPDLQKIHAAAKHQLGLINDILDLSKIEAGQMSLFLETFDIDAAVRDITTTIRPLVAKNSNRLDLDCAVDLGAMRADQTKVRQILFNLLSNAAKFTDKGLIRLEVRNTDSRITFTVRDTGIGMTPEQLGRLFRAFSQAEVVTARKYGGTGLGLAISKKFCQMMGGDLTAESELGKGSTFVASLPIEVQEPAASSPTEVAPATATAPRPAARLTDCTVLVVDDEPAARDLVQRVLSKEGYRVETAVSGPEALAVVRRLQPDAITLDVMMAGMDGWAVLTALKADPSTRDIPVVMLTVMDEKNLGFALGATDYLIKPIEWDRLIAVLQKLRRRHLRDLVLIVEDDPDSREMLRRAAEKEGCRVVEAENGRVALERVAEQLPGVILLDLMMPEMDGFAFVEELRRRPDCRRVPVIVVTAKELTAQDRHRLNGDVVRIFQKGGCSTRELLEELQKLLSSTAELGKDI